MVMETSEEGLMADAADETKRVPRPMTVVHMGETRSMKDSSSQPTETMDSPQQRIDLPLPQTKMAYAERCAE